MTIPQFRTAAFVAALTAAVAGVAGMAQDALDPAEWREVEPERIIVIDTSKGRILVETAPEFAPNHVARFSLLFRSGFYDGTIFHRVIDDFMVQGGDPTGTGTGGTGTNIEAEFFVDRDESLPVVEISSRGYNRGGFWHGMPVETQPIAQLAVRQNGTVESWLSHCAGVVSTARSEDEDSADSQFFLMRYGANAQGNPNTFLDRTYTAWGRVVGGLDVVRAINVGTVRETPGFVPDTLLRARVASDIPEGERPRAWVLREDGSDFQELIASLTDENGNPPDVCDVPIPTHIEDPENP